MATPTLAILGLGAGEILIILAALVVLGLVLVGALALAFLIIRSLQNKRRKP
jgi:hypothetical protein